MTSIDRPVLTVRSTADLIAAVPYLLGFHPTDSIVVVAMRDRRVVFAARADLPGANASAGAPSAGADSPAGVDSPAGGAPAGGAPPDAAPGPGAQEVAEYLTMVVERQGVQSVTIVGYGVPSLVTPVVDALRAAFARAGRHVLDALRVTDGRYWSYLCDNPECCPPEGVAFDQDTSQIAAAATYAGQVALPDRATLARQIAPVTGADRESMRQATTRAMTRLSTLLDGVPPIEPVGDRIMRGVGEPAVRDALDRYRYGGRLTDDEVAWLTLLLVHIPVRDHAWQQVEREDFQLALWTDVLRRAEPDLVPAPACLLAFAAWRLGQGALASLALERALQARPDYSMALLLEDVLRRGVPPSTLDGWPDPAEPEDRSRRSSGSRRPGDRPRRPRRAGHARSGRHAGHGRSGRPGRHRNGTE